MVKCKVIQQSQMTADCWLVQMWGLQSCETCELKGKKGCGGKKILAKIAKGKFPSDGLPGKVTTKERI